MAYTFKDLQDEVKRRATMNQSGTTFDTAIKNIINTALFRTNREAPWRTMRRKTFFTTKTSYSTGTGAVSVTNNSTSVSVTGATLLTDGIVIGRFVKLGGSSQFFIIRTITSETAFTIDRVYDGTTSTTQTYEILPQEEYNLPVQAGHRMFMWHRDFGYPFKMVYVPDQEFFESGVDVTEKNTPTHYRMWGEDMVIEQLRAASVITVVSSNANDTNIGVTVFGTVSGYPDFEVVTTDASNGTTPVSGSKSFSSVERVVKNSTSVGRITATANSTNTTVAVLPVGDTTAGILYRKVQFYPLPTRAFDTNVQYYKDPYRLVNDGDVHELGQDFDEAIILLATSKVKGETEIKTGTQTFFSFWQDEVKSLRRTNMDKIDWFPRLKRPKESRIAGARLHPNLMFRQVGPNFGPSHRR